MKSAIYICNVNFTSIILELPTTDVATTEPVTELMTEQPTEPAVSTVPSPSGKENLDIQTGNITVNNKF